MSMLLCSQIPHCSGASQLPACVKKQSLVVCEHRVDANDQCRIVEPPACAGEQLPGLQAAWARCAQWERFARLTSLGRLRLLGTQVVLACK